MQGLWDFSPRIAEKLIDIHDAGIFPCSLPRVDGNVDTDGSNANAFVKRNSWG